MPKSESTDSFFVFMGYKTLLIRDSEKLRLYLDNIVVETPKGELRFLISDLKFLIIDNHKTTLSVQLINKLMENNVSLVCCNLSHLPYTQLFPINGNYATGSAIKKQLEWDEQLKQVLHQKIIQAKINSQIEILKKNSCSINVINRLTEFMMEVQPGDVTNREGLSAKMYFRELFSPDFIRFNDDIFNASLNYGYSIFRSLISSLLISKGLLLSIGIYHKGPTNPYNLSDDIIEVFRPLVDDYVYNHLFGEELLTLKHRDALIQLTDNKILFDNKLQTITNCIEMYIESILHVFDINDIGKFIAPSLKRIEK